MKKVYLVFQSTSDIAEFVIKRRITNAQVNSREISLTAILTEEDITVARQQYHAQQMRSTAASAASVAF